MFLFNKKNLCIFFLLITHLFAINLQTTQPAVSYEVETSSTFLNLSVQKAVETRRVSEMDRVSKERGTQIENDLALEFGQAAPDFSSGDTHESNIINFIRMNYHQAPENYYFVDSTRVGKREFVFIDNDHKIVIKIFPLNKSKNQFFKIVHELSGNDALKKLNPSKFDLVNFTSLTKYTLNGTDYLMLDMPLKKGKEVRKFFALIDQATDATQKREAIDFMKKMLKNLGESLASLHDQSAIQVIPSEDYHQAIVGEYKKFFQNELFIYEERGGLESDLLQKRFDSLIAKYDRGSRLFSYYHGDAHLGNFLYDPESGNITIIDSVKGHLSVDPLGNPISDNQVQDIVKIEQSIMKEVLTYNVSEDIVQELVDAFHEGYEVEACGFIDSSHLEIERFTKALKLLNSSMSWKSKEDPIQREAYLRRYILLKKLLF